MSALPNNPTTAHVQISTEYWVRHSAGMFPRNSRAPCPFPWLFCASAGAPAAAWLWLCGVAWRFVSRLIGHQMGSKNHRCLAPWKIMDSTISTRVTFASNRLLTHPLTNRVKSFNNRATTGAYEPQILKRLRVRIWTTACKVCISTCQLECVPANDGKSPWIWIDLEHLIIWFNFEGPVQACCSSTPSCSNLLS